jgi:hypothetical protein
MSIAPNDYRNRAYLNVLAGSKQYAVIENHI